MKICKTQLLLLYLAYKEANYNLHITTVFLLHNFLPLFSENFNEEIFFNTHACDVNNNNLSNNFLFVKTEADHKKLF